MKTKVTITTPKPDTPGSLVIRVAGEDGTTFVHHIVDKDARAALEDAEKNPSPGRRVTLNLTT